MTEQIARIRITLDDIEPAIWRRVELPLSNSLKTLHLAIQAVMLFENYHLFRFDVGEASYGICFDDDYMDPPTRDAGNIRLAKLIERGVTAFAYTYDFGDDWRHSIVIEEVLPPIQLPLIPGSSMATVARAPRTSAVHRGSRNFSTPWPGHATQSTNPCSNGMGAPLIQTTSARTKSTREWQRSPNAVLPAKPPAPAQRPDNQGGRQTTLTTGKPFEYFKVPRLNYTCDRFTGDQKTQVYHSIGRWPSRQDRLGDIAGGDQARRGGTGASLN